MDVKFMKYIITADNGRLRVKFCVSVGLPVQMHAEQIEVDGHFVSLLYKFTLF